MFTHYHPETKTLLAVGVCENCDSPVQEPNACGYNDPAGLVRFVYRKLEGSLPPETFHCNELGHSACYGCK